MLVFPGFRFFLNTSAGIVSGWATSYSTQDLRVSLTENIVPLLISVRELAPMLSIAPQTLRLWACTGRLPIPVFKIGGRLKFRRRDVESWVLAGKMR